jgi:hypothetical protein
MDLNERTKEESGDGSNYFIKAVAGYKMAVHKYVIELMIDRYK